MYTGDFTRELMYLDSMARMPPPPPPKTDADTRKDTHRASTHTTPHTDAHTQSERPTVGCKCDWMGINWSNDEIWNINNWFVS